MKSHLFKFMVAGTMLAMGMVFFFSSCKKSPGDPGPDNPSGQLSDADSLKLLMYNIMQVSMLNGGRDKKNDLPSYYWYNQVPSLNPLSSMYPDAPSLLSQMRSYAKDQFGQPLDKYSFLDDGKVSDEIGQGIGGDIGLQVNYAYDADNNIVLVVLYAEKGSPAYVAGVQRGWIVTAINGQSVAYDGSTGPNVKRVVNAVYYDPQATFTFKKHDNSIANITLAQAQYQINPVLFDSVYTIAGKKVGYFVFTMFSDVGDGSSPTFTRQELNRVFSKFKSNNISSLIVDLRYNGGGSVRTAEYMDSMIAPASATGKLMYRYEYNEKVNNQLANLGFPDKVLFKGTGGLNLDKVFFIGTGSTASASELTLNNLRPFMEVKLVGDTTYGKPVGFFGFHISIYKQGVKKDLADLYAINFETKNSANLGGYFNGIAPDIHATDYIGLPWGSADDDNLDKIFTYLETGVIKRTSPEMRLKNDKTLKIPMRETMHPLRFNGMIEPTAGKILQEANK